MDAVRLVLRYGTVQRSILVIHFFKHQRPLPGAHTLEQQPLPDRTAFEIIAEKAKSVDPTLEHYVLGEGTKLVRAVEQIEGRLKRSLKQKEEVAVNQIRNLKSKLFPSGGLQERNESFFQFLVSEGFDWMDELADQCNPLDKSFLVLLV